MSRHFRAVLGLTYGIAAAIAASATQAAPASDGRDSPQTIFIDLTGMRDSPSSSKSAAPNSSAAATNNLSGTLFVDLTKSDAPAALPDRKVPPSKTPHTRHIDLSNAAAPPDGGAMEDDAEPEPIRDTVTITADRLNDPYEETNRGRFRTHVALHRYVIDPVERAYFAVVPVPARNGLHNFLTNLETPSALANDVFQGDVNRTGDTLSRFVINSTLGIAGIFDIAGMAGIPYRDDDFGATLATYGVSDYPYLLIPVIGPSNPRDLTGKVVDFFLNPIRYLALPGGFVTSAGHAGLHELDKRSMDVGELDMLARTAPDAYATERTRARERRNAELNATPPTRQ